MILNDKTLRADWEKELEDTRLSMLSLRKQLAEALQNASGSNRFGFLADHRGMFSRLEQPPIRLIFCAKNMASIWSGTAG